MLKMQGILSAGIYGALLLAQMVCKIYDIETGHMVVACNNESAGHKLSIGTTHQSPPMTILTCWTQSISSANYFPSPPSSGMSKLTNVKSTELGKLSTNGQSGMTKWIPLQKPTGHSKLVYGKEWAVWVNGKKMCKQFSGTLRDAIHSDSLTQWWMKESRTKRAEFTQMQIELMDTVAAKAAWTSAKTV
jgi:hypothetical protein